MLFTNPLAADHLGQKFSFLFHSFSTGNAPIFSALLFKLQLLFFSPREDIECNHKYYGAQTQPSLCNLLSQECGLHFSCSLASFVLPRPYPLFFLNFHVAIFSGTQLYLCEFSFTYRLQPQHYQPRAAIQLRAREVLQYSEGARAQRADLTPLISLNKTAKKKSRTFHCIIYATMFKIPVDTWRINHQED